jgi:hypothetical protein
LTSDIWTTDDKTPFMAITAHYIKDWELKIVLMDFIHIPGSHSGVNIAKFFNDAIDDVGFVARKNLWLDNASNNDAFVSSLHLYPEYDILHVRCLGHILNLICQAATSNIKDSVLNLKGLVIKVRDSSLGRLALSNKCEEMSLKNLVLTLDVPTRWNSTFMMVKRCLFSCQQLFFLEIF